MSATSKPGFLETQVVVQFEESGLVTADGPRESCRGRDHFDLGEYKDLYTERMTELIQARVEGKEIVAPPAAEEPAVINLMDALKKCVAQVKRPEQGMRAKPQRKIAGSRKKRATKQSSKKGGRKKTG